MWDTSLALDSSERPHISYYRKTPTTGDLRYARFDGTDWVIQTVESSTDSPGAGRFNSLAVDSSENARIAYTLEDAGVKWVLKYAVWTGTTWSIQTVDSAGAVGFYCSLALDSNDRARIAYVDASNDVLKYAEQTDSTSWSFQTVADVGVQDPYVSLALDSSGYPHIAYAYSDLVTFTDDIRYAVWNGTSWDVSTVDDSANTRGHISLALDASNLPRIAYVPYSLSAFKRVPKYAEWNGTTWEIETIDDSVDLWYHACLALADDGVPHVTYIGCPTLITYDLRHAVTGGPVPVSLCSLGASVSPASTAVEFDWLDPRDVVGFELRRRNPDRPTFETVHTMAAANDQQHYRIVDPDGAPGMIYEIVTIWPDGRRQSWRPVTAR